jgi:hypothetical protein
MTPTDDGRKLGGIEFEKGTDMPNIKTRCTAYDCAEPRQTEVSEFCVGHQGELWRFFQWLDGWDEHGAVPRSFDVERSAWAGSTPGTYTK